MFNKTRSEVRGAIKALPKTQEVSRPWAVRCVRTSCISKHYSVRVSRQGAKGREVGESTSACVRSRSATRGTSTRSQEASKNIGTTRDRFPPANEIASSTAMTTTSTLKFTNTGNSKDRSAIFAITKTTGRETNWFYLWVPNHLTSTLHKIKLRKSHSIISSHIPGLVAMCLSIRVTKYSVHSLRPCNSVFSEIDILYFGGKGTVQNSRRLQFFNHSFQLLQCRTQPVTEEN